MDIEIKFAEDLDHDNIHMLDAIMRRMMVYQNLERCTIHPAKRKSDGWLEFIYILKFADGGQMTIGCIQRKPGDSFEFHS